ncbi:MAG: hypothetical protein GY945_12725 [Rhodobacteraceae bacterium]|nr:hypothetical protein [Paracoccaceae bacterium]
MKHRPTITACAISLLPFLPTAGQAEAGFTLPEGCSAVLSTQTGFCGANLHWTCQDDPRGHVRKAYFDVDGLASILTFNAQSAIIDAQYMWDNSREVLIGEPLDTFSVDALQTNLTESYAWQLSRTDESGTRSLSMTGTDTLTGDALRVGDHVLPEVATSFEYLEEDGSLNYRGEGTYYLMSDPILVISGSGQAMDPDGRFEYDETPVELIFPGQPGFGDTTPRNNCDDAAVEQTPPEAPTDEPPATPEPVITDPGTNKDK